MYAAGRQQCQLHVVARRQRQRRIGARVDHLAEQSRLGLQHGRRRSHFDGRRDVADLKLEIQLGNLVHFQRDVGLRGRLETRLSTFTL